MSNVSIKVPPRTIREDEGVFQNFSFSSLMSSNSSRILFFSSSFLILEDDIPSKTASFSKSVCSKDSSDEFSSFCIPITFTKRTEFKKFYFFTPSKYDELFLLDHSHCRVFG